LILNFERQAAKTREIADFISISFSVNWTEKIATLQFQTDAKLTDRID
jgi:hypothetical protein